MADETTPAARLRRADGIRAYDVEDRLVLVGPDGAALEVKGDSADLARCVLSFLEQAHTSAEVCAHVEALTGEPLADPAIVHDLVRLLVQVEAVALVNDGHGPARRPRTFRHRPVRVVLGLTGAVASMSAPAMIQALHRSGCHVRVIATANALRFVTADAIEALTHHPPISSLWPGPERMAVPHIHLAQWADAVVICPASATTISRLATANHDCVVSATALATRAPVLVVPSMNPAMYASSGVQRNLAQLCADGMHVAHPAAGLEMADAPLERVPLLGAAPAPRIVVPLVLAMVRAHGTARRRAGSLCGDDWDAMYRQHAERDLPWQAARIDDDLLRELDALTRSPAAILDVGTGLGMLAVECARRGHRVVATDLSPVALERARAVAPEAPIVWLEDDITASKLHGTFDLVVDRGCLHLLAEAEAVGWARSITRLCAQGGALVVKTLAEPAAAERGARAWSSGDFDALFGSAFAIERDEPSTLPGPSDAPPARLFVLRRR